MNSVKSIVVDWLWYSIREVAPPSAPQEPMEDVNYDFGPDQDFMDDRIRGKWILVTLDQIAPIVDPPLQNPTMPTPISSPSSSWAPRLHGNHHVQHKKKKSNGADQSEAAIVMANTING